jgi:cyclopropane-fatty-acyl-phospholipid synthase
MQMSGTTAESAVDAFIARIGANSRPFSIEMPDGRIRTVGEGEPVFRATLRNDRGVTAVRSLDEGNIAEAYMRGDVDLDGDMLQPFALRAALDDRHPLANAWRFLQPLLFGQVYTNKQAIKSHYDADPRLFLSFLDATHPAYSQGVYENDDERLATALERKFDYAVERCELSPGKRVLEIGPGWGAFAGHALKSDIDFTGITISAVSQDYLTKKLSAFSDRFRILLTDFLTFEPKEKFDAIVIMGVIEHLPQYERVLTKFCHLLNPGGAVFLDGSASRHKYEFSSFMARYIYPGNHSYLVLDDLLNKLKKTPLDLVEVFNDGWSYFLTFRQWALNLEKSKDFVCKEFGDFEFRKFRLYLWALAHQFQARYLDCYRMTLYKPKAAA